MKYEEIAIGQVVYNRGDRANASHRGVVVQKTEGKLKIEPEEGSGSKYYWVYPNAISDVDKGNGMTRIVTIEAHQVYRQKQIENLKAQYAKLLADKQKRGEV